MNALITGITGFVGGYLAEELLAAGDCVFGCSRTGNWPADLRLPVELLAWNLACDEPSPECTASLAAFTPDVIFHLAAMSVPSECGHDRPTFEAWRANVDGTARVLRLAGSLPRRPRVVFASSSRVYSPVTLASPVVDETSPCEPATAYGQTKLAAEQRCFEGARRDGLDVVVARSFPQAGPRQDARLMLAEWARQYAAGSDEITVGSLDVTIDLLDVRDGARALRLLSQHGEPGGVYNIGSGQRRTTGEVLQRLEQCVGRKVAVRERSPGRRSDPIANIDRLTSVTGWRPEIPLEQTIADAWDYWRGHGETR